MKEDAFSTMKEIRAVIPQGSVLRPILYLLYTSNVPQTEITMMATFADDMAIFVVGENTSDTIQQEMSGSKLRKM